MVYNFLGYIFVCLGGLMVTDYISAKKQLDIAKKHLEKVLIAWDKPTDWSDLSIYGFYCLEAGVMAAAKHFGKEVPPNHKAKADAAEELSKEHGLKNIKELLVDLNEARKAAAYGDIE